MTTEARADVGRRLADKSELLRILEAQDARTGFVPDPDATAEKASEMMLAAGIRPEQNLFSRELLAIREE